MDTLRNRTDDVDSSSARSSRGWKYFLGFRVGNKTKGSGRRTEYSSEALRAMRASAPQHSLSTRTLHGRPLKYRFRAQNPSSPLLSLSPCSRTRRACRIRSEIGSCRTLLQKTASYTPYPKYLRTRKRSGEVGGSAEGPFMKASPIEYRDILYDPCIHQGAHRHVGRVGRYRFTFLSRE
jgi:hypothetical protein